MGRTAFLFPGQGSQSVGMMSGLASSSGVVKDTFDEASDVLGYDLWALCERGPEEELNRTEKTQPAMLAAGYATWRAWHEEGGDAADFLAGHSLGEYTALVVGASLAFTDAVSLVAERARLMQEAAPEGVGAMAAVLGFDDAALEALCRSEAGDEVVECANYNAPGQVVIAGHRAAVERVCAAAREAGARRVVVLPVSVPSHCALMKNAARSLRDRLDATEVLAPRVPVIHNADVSEQSDPDAIRDVLARQLWRPVQWTRTIRHLLDEGVAQFIECGPGKVLAGLNRRMARDEAKTHALVDAEAIENAMAEEDT